MDQFNLAIELHSKCKNQMQEEIHVTLKYYSQNTCMQHLLYQV